MRTTLNLDDHLLISAKHRAVEESVSLACVIENAIQFDNQALMAYALAYA